MDFKAKTTTELLTIGIRGVVEQPIESTGSYTVIADDGTHCHCAVGHMLTEEALKKIGTRNCAGITNLFADRIIEGPGLPDASIDWHAISVIQSIYDKRGGCRGNCKSFAFAVLGNSTLGPYLSEEARGLLQQEIDR